MDRMNGNGLAFTGSVCVSALENRRQNSFSQYQKEKDMRESDPIPF